MKSGGRAARRLSVFDRSPSGAETAPRRRAGGRRRARGAGRGARAGREDGARSRGGARRRALGGRRGRELAVRSARSPSGTGRATPPRGAYSEDGSRRRRGVPRNALEADLRRRARLHGRGGGARLPGLPEHVLRVQAVAARHADAHPRQQSSLSPRQQGAPRPAAPRGATDASTPRRARGPPPFRAGRRTFATESFGPRVRPRRVSLRERGHIDEAAP